MGEIGLRSKQATFLLLSLIVAAGVIPYWEVIAKGYFLGEDFSHLSGGKYFPFRDAVYILPGGTFFRPLAEAFWKLEYLAFGTDATFFHLTSAALNCINACLLWFIVEDATASRRLGFFSGLLFAVYPLHAEPVSWLAASNDLLCAAFFLAAVLVFGNYLRNGGRQSYLAAVLFFIIALCIKETAIVLPLVFLLYDYLWGKRAVLKEKLKLYLPFLFLMVVYIAARFTLLGGMGAGEKDPKKLLNHPSRPVKGFFVDMPLSFLSPVNRSIFHGYSTLIFYITIAVLLAFFLYRAGDVKQERRVLLFSIGLICLACLPVIGILSIDNNLWNSRFLYLPSAGFCIILAWLVTGIFKRGHSHAKFAVLTVIIMGFYGVLLYNNNAPYVESSSRTRVVYSDIEKLSVHSRKDLVILFLGPPCFYSDTGARFLCHSIFGLGLLFSTPERSVATFQVRREQVATKTAAKNKDEGFKHLELQKPKWILWDIYGPYYIKANSVISGEKSAKDLDIDMALVRWDEKSGHVSVLTKTF